MANFVICEREDLEAIADVIRNKTNSAYELSLGDMPTAIAEIEKDADNEVPDPIQVYEETRPLDWLPMPTPNEDEMYLLFHIPDGVSSLLAFKVVCTGNYSVELGTVNNGAFVPTSSTSLPSESIYEAELFSSDFGDLTSDGNKQVMVKVSGTNITQWEPSTHTKKSSPTNYKSWSIVEISCNLPNGEKIVCGGSALSASLRQMQYFSWQGKNALKDASSMFSFCGSLKAILMLDTQNVTNMTTMFSYCSSLKAIPILDTQNVTIMASMFIYCYSLTTIPMLNTQKVISMSYMFGSCYSLTTIPMLNTQNVTNMANMFNNCRALKVIPMLNTQNVTNMANMFSACYSLTAIPILDTQKVTSMSNMFPDTLQAISLNPTISNWRGATIPLKDCSLGHTALIQFFNSLPTITSSYAITLTGNPGVSELTDSEKAIATEKGWTLTL